MVQKATLFDFPKRPDPTPEEACKLTEEFEYMVIALAKRWNKTPEEVLTIVDTFKQQMRR